MIKRRDERLDLLKAIGLLMLMLAHTGLKNNDPVYHLRCFDVPLMVMLSGVSFSYKKDLGNIFSFFKKRIIRLVWPAWAFSIGYYLIGYKLLGYDIFSQYLSGGFLLSATYLWIYRIFLYMMLLTPILFWIRKTRFVGLIITLAAVVWSIISVCFNFSSSMLLKQIGFIAGYGIIFAIGFYIKDTPKKVLPVIIMAIIGTFWYMGSGIAITGTFFPFSAYKWPPTTPFICYGLSIATLLYFIVNTFISPNSKIPALFTYIGRRTDAIYLVHIGALVIMPGNPYVKYLLVLISSILIVWVYDEVKSIVLKTKTKNQLD